MSMRCALPEDFEPVSVLSSGEQCDVMWTPWMGDFFTGWNLNNGHPWDHWVDLAIRILQDPLTAIVRPEAAAAVAALETHGFYDETHRALTRAELDERFKRGPEEEMKA